MDVFEKAYSEWIERQMDAEKSPRRLERLQSGLGHGTKEYLRKIWFPTVNNLKYLYAEWEMRDLNNGVRYQDLAYMPGNAKGNIEIHGYSTHARDVSVKRFKDLCNRQSLIVMDGWTVLTVAYPSVEEEPELCKQYLLAFIGGFVSIPVDSQLNWLEAESVRFAQRLLRPFTPAELATHLRISVRHTRRVLHRLVELHQLVVHSGNERIRTYQLLMRGINHPK